MDPQWLDWAKRLQAIAQTGITYTKEHYDTERYEAVRQIAAEILAAGTGAASIEPIADLLTRDTGYATPKVDVRAAVIHEDRILLVKETEDGGWSLPGGWADVGDVPSLAVAREVREESGYEVKARKLAAVLDRNLHGHPFFPFHAYKLFFLCDLVGGNAAPSYETDGAGFFAEDALPPLSLTRVMPAQIELMFEHYRHPELPATFD
ncbi:MAG: NUDIX hydrolase [Bryobacteraceae bacterium]|nr:NUDIX hydrolase [Bryobacteraceae bacterium]